MGLAWVVEQLLALIPIIGDSSGEKRRQADEALSSVSEALRETKLYVDRYIDKHQCDQDIEADLCRLWSKAAIPLRHFDVTLSQICEYKAHYWLNPEVWDDGNSKGLAIDIDSVTRKYEQLLFGEKEQ